MCPTTGLQEIIAQSIRKKTQRNWEWVDVPPATTLPGRIGEQIDYDHDGVVDFEVELNSKASHAALKPLRPEVLGCEGVMLLKDGCVLRIDLKRKK